MEDGGLTQIFEMERMAGNSEGARQCRDYEVRVLDLNSLGGLGLENKNLPQSFWAGH